jgi:hypothetical protein
MALLTLSHSSENWTDNNSVAGKSILELKSCVSKDTPKLNKIRSQDILKELNMYSVSYKIDDCRAMVKLS